MTYHTSGMPTTERIISPQSSHLFLTSFIFIFFNLIIIPDTIQWTHGNSSYCGYFGGIESRWRSSIGIEYMDWSKWWKSFIVWYHFVVKRRRGGVACSFCFFVERHNWEEYCNQLWSGMNFVGGLSRLIFLAWLPPLPVLVDLQVIAPPVSVAAQWGSCHQLCMLLDLVWWQAPLLAILRLYIHLRGNG